MKINEKSKKKVREFLESLNKPKESYNISWDDDRSILLLIDYIERKIKIELRNIIRENDGIYPTVEQYEEFFFYIKKNIKCKVEKIDLEDW